MKKITQSTFGIIGNGRFGKLWSEAIKNHGTVKIFDKKSKNTSIKKIKETVDCDMLFLLVPISEMEKICKKISPFLNKKTIVIDACSVKTHPVQIMEKWLPKDQPIIATHPLFGPDSTKKIGLKGQKIVFSPIRATKNQIATFEALIRKIGLKIIKATPEKHDKEMASSQALVHFIGRGLSALKLLPQEISTPDFESLLQMNEMVKNDSWKLFFDMHTQNIHAKQIRKQFIDSLKKLDEKIEELSRTPSIQNLRREINNLDHILIDTISKRLKIARKIGQTKKREKLKIHDEKREEKLKKLHGSWGNQKKINPKTIHDIFDLIIQESRNIQQ